MSRPGSAQYDMQIKVRNTFCFVPLPEFFPGGKFAVGRPAHWLCVAVARIPPGAYRPIRAVCDGSFEFALVLAVPVPAGAERSDLSAGANGVTITKKKGKVNPLYPPKSTWMGSLAYNSAV